MTFRTSTVVFSRLRVVIITDRMNIVALSLKDFSLTLLNVQSYLLTAETNANKWLKNSLETITASRNNV